MELTKNDSSGTDEDLSTQNINRNTRSTLFSRAMRIPSMTISQGMDATDVEFQIHSIEKEAYSAVLRAFISQSDVLSWDKEGLISELRKELRVSDVEHRELLVKVDSDNSVRMIREWRKGTASGKELLSHTMNPTCSVPSSMGHASRKRLKTSRITMSSSPNYLSHAQPSPAAIPSLATHYRDGQWGGETTIFSTQGNVGQSMKSVGHNRKASNVSKGRGMVIVQSKKGFLPPGTENFNRRSDTIEIRATDKLIHEVERVICGGGNLDPVQLEKAKLILRDHERAILDALDKLADVSDGDDSPDQSRHWNSHEELQSGHGSMTHHPFYGQGDRMKGFSSDGFGRDHTDRAGIPSIDLQDDEGTP